MIDGYREQFIDSTIHKANCRRQVGQIPRFSRISAGFSGKFPNIFHYIKVTYKFL